MKKLFGRVARIGVAPRTPGAGGALAAVERGLGFDVSNLDCAFKVKKSLKPEPNTCELRIYNMADSTRNILQTSKRVMVRLEAGYKEAGLAQLFLGEVRAAHSRREGPDIVTEISSGDSEKEMQTARVSFAVGPDVPVAVILSQIAEALGVGIGNALVMAAKLQARGVNFFGDGSALFGNAALALTSFCLSADLEWSIQDGNLQLIERGTALETKGALLSAETGLIGSPTIDHKGVVTATALIQPDIAPGRYVQIKSLAFTGAFRVIDCEFLGDTRGDEWFVRLSGKLPKQRTL